VKPLSFFIWLARRDLSADFMTDYPASSGDLILRLTWGFVFSFALTCGASFSASPSHVGLRFQLRPHMCQGVSASFRAPASLSASPWQSSFSTLFRTITYQTKCNRLFYDRLSSFLRRSDFKTGLGLRLRLCPHMWGSIFSFALTCAKAISGSVPMVLEYQ
jgi:hypothetical protein